MPTALDNVEVMFVPKDVFDLPGTVCPPADFGGMHYLGPFLPSTTAVKAANAYWLTLRVISQYPGWIAPAKPVTTSSLLVAQPIVPDATGSPTPSPVKVDNPNDHLGDAMTDWIDRPPPGGGSAIGSWTFEQTIGFSNHPDVTFTIDFALENDPRILTIDATRSADYVSALDAAHYFVVGGRSFTVSLSEGQTKVSVTASSPQGWVDQFTTPPPANLDPRSFTTTDPTGTLRDLVVNVRWVEDNLFVVITA